MSDFSAVKNAPDVSFIDGKTIDDVRREMVADYEAYMAAAMGRAISLDRASVHRMELYAASAQIFQALQYVDRAGKQNLLKYSYSDFLDNLGRFKGVERGKPRAATTTLRFTISAVRAVAVGIPKGTKAVSAGSVYFETEEYAEIPAGASAVDVSAVCTVTGIEGNGLASGELDTMVEPLPYIESVANVTETAGGAEKESDESYAENIFLAPGAYSTAGPEGGYIFHARKFNSNVGDVVATSNQAAGTVNLVFILADGSAPGEEMIAGLQEYLRDNNVRPMTDVVTVSAPEEVPYSINMAYYINRSDSARAVAIQAAVETAVADYQVWQRTIGRDINPSKLVELAMAAGAKRVEITAPVHTRVGATAVAAISGQAAIQYGGLEDD